MAELTFVFGKQNSKNTYSRQCLVSKESLYDSKSGYGFIVEKNCEEEELLQIPELNSGFVKAPEAVVYTKVLDDVDGCYVENGDVIPLIFKVNVRRLGNYEVTITLLGQGEISIFAGYRNLVFQDYLEEAKEVELMFDMNLSSIIPKDKTCMYENRSIDIAVLGKNVKIKRLSIKEVNCPTLYIAGDSLITEHSTYYPFSRNGSTAGWGQMLPAFVKKGVAVSNQSRDDLNVESFRTEGNFSLAQAHMRLGDYLLLHFAKNDSETKTENYIAALTSYIEEARAMGVYPILVTPMSLLEKDERSSLSGVCKELAQKLNVPIIDLYKACKEQLMQLANGELFDSTGCLNDIAALEVAKVFVSSFLIQMEGQRPDAYTKLSRYFIK